MIAEEFVMNGKDNKEDFVLCVSRTTCIHCQDYKNPQ